MINHTQKKYILLKAEKRGDKYIARFCSESIWIASQKACNRREYLNNNSFLAYISEETLLKGMENGIGRNEFVEIC